MVGVDVSQSDFGRLKNQLPSLDQAYQIRQNEDDHLIVPDPSLSALAICNLTFLKGAS